MRANRDPLYWAAWLVLLAVVAFFSRSYTPIDETRYLSVAWEMWQRGDFLVPFKNGAPYSHKPPLLFWLMHAGWAITGVNDWWPRLISPLLAFASLLLLRRLATELWPDQPGHARLAPWILLGSMLWAMYSQTIMFDLLMAFCTLLGILALVRAARGKPYAWRLFALSICLGVLAKGPAILLHLLPAALLAPWWNAHHALPLRRWYARLALATLAGAGLALLWAVPAGIMGGEEYRRAIFWGQTANRMVQSFAHQRPIWWYLPLLPILLFPWFVWPAFWHGLRGGAHIQDGGLRLALSWMLPAFLAFSVISGKQIHYLLPEFPAFALLASKWLGAQRKMSRPWLPALALMAMAVLLWLPARSFPAEAASVLSQVPVWGGPFFLLLALATLWLHDRPSVLVPRLAAITLLAMVGMHVALIRPISLAYDVRPMAQAIAQVQGQAREVANIGEYHAQYQFAGRLHRPMTELRETQEILDWLRTHPQDLAVMYVSKGEDMGRFHPLFVQPYRGQQAVLLDAPQAMAALARSKPADSKAEEQ